MSRKEKKTQTAPPTDPGGPEEEVRPSKAPSKATIACAGCAGAFVIAAVIGIIAATSWDTKASRVYKAAPLPTNVGYIGRWVSDDTLSMRIDTFAIAGDKVACDFAVKNETDQPVTVNAIGRTIIAQPIDHLFSYKELPLELVPDDKPMQVTDEETVLGIATVYGQLALVVPQESSDVVQPEPFTLKPGEMKRLRYRPQAHQFLMPASALRLAVQLSGSEKPHPFYFLSQSSGIGAWFEKGAEKAIENAR